MKKETLIIGTKELKLTLRGKIKKMVKLYYLKETNTNKFFFVSDRKYSQAIAQLKAGNLNKLNDTPTMYSQEWRANKALKQLNAIVGLKFILKDIEVN